MGILEETITDVNLLEISACHDDFVMTQKYTRREEGAKSGADWLWCIGEPGSWISMLVQAKIINPKTQNCPRLDYRSGEQRRMLVKFAKSNKLLPLYCIYSHVPDGISPLSKALTSLSSLDSKEWSCTLISPRYVRNFLKKEKRNKWICFVIVCLGLTLFVMQYLPKSKASLTE